MIAELGNFALSLALIVSAVMCYAGLVGTARGSAVWMLAARPAAVAMFLLSAFAFGALTHAFVVSDFTVSNVVANSHTAKPMLYKISGVWGNHEGSMLLWVLMLSLFGCAVALLGRNLPPGLRARVLGVQGAIAFGFLLFILLTSNPFDRVVPPPADGRGLNPLLQDPGLAFHPPMLYLGYVGLSVTFCFAIAALIEGKVDAAWARWVRPWTLAAWAALTLGIGLGSWWAYYELGWGGWWFWDPVENASFMPWLAATALLHSAIVVEKRDALKTWTVLLAIIAFSFSLLGTFLVRSGVLTSVHAFATDPARGLYILLFLLAVIGGSLTLFAIRAPAMKGGGLFAPVSREGALVLNNLLLSTALATVLLGTLYPLFLEVTTGDKVSVGPPFFNATFVPLMVPLVVAMAIGPMLGWKRGDIAGALGRLKLAGLAVVAAIAITFWAKADGPPLALLGIAIAAWLFVGALVEFSDRIRLFRIPLSSSLARIGGLPRAAWGLLLGHLGMAVLVAGVTGSSAWTVEKIQSLGIGDSIDVAGYEFTLTGVSEGQGPNYQYRRGTFRLTEDGDHFAILEPEKRFFPVERNETTEAAIRTTFLGDLYAVIGDQTPDGKWVARLYFNPLVPWIWAGCLMMVAGGVASISDRRLRIGAPQRRRAAADPAPQPAE
jgi:cytochrome c-type biogenesis protein CcmF